MKSRISMSNSKVNGKPCKVQKLCTLWTHDDNFSRDDIVFNGEKFPELPTAPGSLLQIVGIESGTAVRDFQANVRGTQVDAPQVRGDRHAQDTSANGPSKKTRRESISMTVDETGSAIPIGIDHTAERAYVFAVTALSADLKSKHANLQVSRNEQCCSQ